MKRTFNKRVVLAIVEMLVGIFLSIQMTKSIISMYLSGTFLPGDHVARYTLYLILFAILVLSFFVVYQNGRYLEIKVKRYIRKYRKIGR